MARLLSNVLQGVIARLPTGWALGKRGGGLDTVFAAVATEIQSIESKAEQLLDELDPRTATAYLEDFERVLGPDACGRDTASLSLERRRKLAHQRWTATGGQSIPYYIGVAAKLGVVVTIEEFWPRNAGGLRAGQRLRNNGCQFLWRVNLPGLVTVTNFKAGASTAGQRLGSFALSDIECELRRLKPAHTTIIFSYGAA